MRGNGLPEGLEAGPTSVAIPAITHHLIFAGRALSQARCWVRQAGRRCYYMIDNKNRENVVSAQFLIETFGATCISDSEIFPDFRNVIFIAEHSDIFIFWEQKKTYEWFQQMR